MMPRLSRSLPAIALALAFTVSTATAQEPSAAAMQTVSGSGYQFQVPSGWQVLQQATQQRRGSEVVTDDGAAASPDGSLRAHVETAIGFSLKAAQLPDVLAAFLGLGLGGGDMSGPAPVAPLTGPDPAQVSNAESAINGAAVYMDQTGSPRVVAARIALRGDTTYMLILDVTEDFYQSNATFSAIVNSLQLMTP